MAGTEPSKTPTRSHRYQRRTKVALLVFVLSGCLVATEGVLAWRFPSLRPYPNHDSGYNAYLASASDYLPFTLPPNLNFEHRSQEFALTYRTNPLGFIGSKPVSIAKTPGVYRILFLGDSFTLGWGNSYQDSFVGLYEAEIARGGGSAEVINAAYRAGYSPDAYYAFLRREGVLLAPDKIVVVVYSGNDLKDIQANVWNQVDAFGAPRSLSTIRKYTNAEGHLIGADSYWYYQIPVLRRSRSFTAAASGIDRALRQIRAPSAHEAKARFGSSIHAIDGYAKEYGAELVFTVIAPRPSACEPSCIEEHRWIVKEIATKTNRSVLDLQEVLLDFHYYQEDGHLNPEGNAAVFQALMSAEAGPETTE